MADAIYICILRFWKSDNWYLPETWQVICQNTRQEQVQQVGKRDPPACEPDRSRHLPDVRTYSRSLRTDVGLLSLNKIPSNSVKNEQKALANPANRIN